MLFLAFNYNIGARYTGLNKKAPIKFIFINQIAAFSIVLKES